MRLLCAYCFPNIRVSLQELHNARNEIAEVQALRDKPVRSAVLLTRCITRAHSTANAREALEDLGYNVLRTNVPRLEVYAQSFGLPIPETGRGVWRHVAGDLIERSFPLRKVQS